MDSVPKLPAIPCHRAQRRPIWRPPKSTRATQPPRASPADETAGDVDDYMSAAFLQTPESPTTHGRGKGKGKGKGKKKGHRSGDATGRFGARGTIGAERRKRKKPTENIHVKKAKATEKALSAPIPASNIGHRLLLKMGWKKGAGLGKEQAGMKAPIPIKVKNDVKGLGKDADDKRRWRAAAAAIQKANQLRRRSFRSVQSAQFAKRSALDTLRKCRRACKTLDLKAGVEANVIWGEEEEKDVDRAGSSSEDEQGMDDLQRLTRPEDIELHPLDRVPVRVPVRRRPPPRQPDSMASIQREVDLLERDVLEVVLYMRDKYFYCHYCAVTYRDENDLNTNCPGVRAADHDE